MSFELPPDCQDTALRLRELEQTAPPGIKPLLIQAAEELEYGKKLAHTLADELNEAAALKIGQMDSQSKADEISKQVRLTLQTVAQRLRAVK